MATFFGEVILPSSRAFFEDIDDSDVDEAETSEKIKPYLSLKQYEKPILSYDTFIIADGSVAIGFAQKHILKDGNKLIAEVVLITENHDHSSDILIFNPKKEETTKLYLLANNSLLLIVSNTVDLSLCNQLTVLMAPWLINSSNVVTLVSRHVANYRCNSTNELPPAFVRWLSTSSRPLMTNLKHLEQPNFISDVPASVLSWCEAREKNALMLILYSDQQLLDLITLKPLINAFSDAGLSQYINERPTTVFSNPLKNMDKSFMYM